MNLISHIKTLGQNIFDLVFPVYCLSCGREGVYLCDACIDKLPASAAQRCIVCQTPSPFGKTHAACVSKHKVDGLISVLPYSNPKVKKIIEAFKYSFVDSLAEPLGSLMAKQILALNLKEYFSDFILVPVPLHSRRFSWRTFNQSELLARQIGKDLGFQVNTNLIKRTVFTKPQVNLNLEERKKNIAGAFAAEGSGTKKVLLIDDVVTSGTTLNEMAKVFKKSGAGEVWAATVAFD
jgi:ComF family protein